jgi:sarcosine oxidase, subunit alpha
VKNRATFENVGQWKRPWYYGDEMHAAVQREALAVRKAVGVLDASTLGKIDIQGRDAGKFLDRIYTGTFSTLGVGKARYGLMCREDGMIFDDGVTARLGENHFHMTTTTGGAARVLDWLEEYVQTEWPELEVYCTSVTEQWATVAVAGPKASDLMKDLGWNGEMPFMTFKEGKVAGIDARVFRISFTGELSYEINVEGRDGLRLWEAVMDAGRKHGITPYGTETMHLLRAEKGFIIVGQETDGTVTPLDLGLDWAVKKSGDFVGRRSLSRADTRRDDRKQLVGLLPEDPNEVLPEGAQITEHSLALPRGHGSAPVPMLGHVTSSYRSPSLGRGFALALVKSGRSRLEQTLYVPLEGRAAKVRITKPVFL